MLQLELNKHNGNCINRINYDLISVTYADLERILGRSPNFSQPDRFDLPESWRAQQP